MRWYRGPTRYSDSFRHSGVTDNANLLRGDDKVEQGVDGEKQSGGDQILSRVDENRASEGADERLDESPEVEKNYGIDEWFRCGRHVDV